MLIVAGCVLLCVVWLFVFVFLLMFVILFVYRVLCLVCNVPSSDLCLMLFAICLFVNC